MNMKTGVLVVDDSDIAVKGVIGGVDWPALDAEPFAAYSSHDARRVLASHEIDIIICDIEMPGDNGLQLIEWVRANYPDIECIFLTSHDNFLYAKKAIALRSFEYLLKPALAAEIQEVVLRARERVAENRMNKKMIDYGVKWVDQKITSAESRAGIKKSPDTMVGEVKSFVLQHLAEDISVEMIARLFYITPDHLTRIFRKYTGRSIVEYIGKERVALAAKMLLESTLPASTIAEAVGYRSYNHFVKMFRKAHGLSPVEYRRQNRTVPGP